MQECIKSGTYINLNKGVNNMQRLKINRKQLKNVGKFGVEIEMYNVNPDMLITVLQTKGILCRKEGYNHSSRSHWKLVTDSTIRDNQGRNNYNSLSNGCWELVSPILNGMDGMKELREVCLALYFIDAKVNKSCGLHIHHDTLAIGGLTDQQRNNLLNFYARCERTIDAFMPKSRKRNNNSMCRSMIEAYMSALNYGSLTHLGRYNKLNFESLQRHGTLEFRQHNSTIEFEKIYHWILFTAGLLHECKDKRSRQSMNFIERAWTPKHLKLSKRTWNFFKERMKVLDDCTREDQNGRIRASLRAA